MKYNYSKCNNLDWKTKSSSGFIKVDGEEITLFTYKNTFDASNGNSCYSYFSMFHSGETLEATIPDFEIVPRNPETYRQFKEGDDVEGGDETGRVVFATPNIIAVNWDCSNGVDWFNYEEVNFSIVQTNYEKQIALKIRKDITRFNPGDRVVGRDTDSDNTWDFGFFVEMSEDGGKPIYVCKSKEFTECLPFNEDTCKLLGTQNNYNGN